MAIRMVRNASGLGPAVSGMSERAPAGGVGRNAANDGMPGLHFAHDTIPNSPPVSLQPHALKGEAAPWVG